MKSNIKALYELAVWGYLVDKKEYELIILKGHVILDFVLTDFLSEFENNKYTDMSFYKKLQIFKELTFENQFKHNFIIECLDQLNLIRNEIAHESLFDLEKSNILIWSENIHINLSGAKFSKYTKRTKFIHSFSILAINILEMDSLKYKMNSQIKY